MVDHPVLVARLAAQEVLLLLRRSRDRREVPAPSPVRPGASQTPPVPREAPARPATAKPSRRGLAVRWAEACPVRGPKAPDQKTWGVPCGSHICMARLSPNLLRPDRCTIDECWACGLRYAVPALEAPR